MDSPLQAAAPAITTAVPAVATLPAVLPVPAGIPPGVQGTAAPAVIILPAARRLPAVTAPAAIQAVILPAAAAHREDTQAAVTLQVAAIPPEAIAEVTAAVAADAGKQHNLNTSAI